MDRTGQDRGHHAGSFYLVEHQLAAMINTDAIDLANVPGGQFTGIDSAFLFNRSCHPRD